ncbi:MAG TPA: ATP-binding protein [Verrucomicrobiae bacterium]|nr:ATP-binding protein [Verrucomicrobiae bacterium]
MYAKKTFTRKRTAPNRARQKARSTAVGSSAARQKARFLEAFFDHSLDCLVFLDKDFNFIRVNEVYAQACKRDVSEFPGCNHFEFYPDKENQAIFENVVRTKTAYQVTAKPFVFPDHPDWGVTYWDWTLVPVLDARGKVDFLVFSLRDVTMRKRMEKSLEESEARYRSLVTATAQIVWATNVQGEVVEELPTWQGFTGQSREQYQGWGWIEAVHPEDRERTRLVWSQAVASRVLYEIEYRMRRQDGQYRLMAVRGAPVSERDGRIREWVGTCTDITEQKEAERRRELTSALLGLFAQKTSAREYLDSVVQIIRQWTGCQALGIRLLDERQEIPYESWSGFDAGFLQLESRLSLERDNCICVRAISGQAAESDQVLKTPSGSFQCGDTFAFMDQLTSAQRDWYRGNCQKFGFASIAVIPLGYHGKVLGAIHMADRRPDRLPRDKIEFIESMAPLITEALHRFTAEAELTKYRDRLEELVQLRTAELESANARLQVEIIERERAQQSLQQTARELERSNRDLEQFAYVASHDLQEPLRAVGGYVKLLERRFPEEVDAKAKEYIVGASDGAARMERLIMDLLAFSRVGTHGTAFAMADLNLLLDEALRNLQTGIETSKAAIEREPLPSLVVDPSRITQLFQNLIGNAIKFRSERPPQIQIGAERRENGWLISVRDNGIGIEPQYFERIFQIFQRLHTRKTYPGTGIGLAICKRIAECHGGSIWVESQPGQGATFYFSIPELSVKTEDPL